MANHDLPTDLAAAYAAARHDAIVLAYCVAGGIEDRFAHDMPPHWGHVSRLANAAAVLETLRDALGIPLPDFAAVEEDVRVSDGPFCKEE